jgi:RimJ/RimL family protein N-acetyltransferase
VRANSFSTAAIPWDTHVSWFRTKLDEPGTVMLIANDWNGDDVGQVRFEQGPDRYAEIHISIAPSKRGLGYAASLISQAAAHFFEHTECESIVALVKANNIASLRAFEKAGFRRTDLAGMPVSNAVQLIRWR